MCYLGLVQGVSNVLGAVGSGTDIASISDDVLNYSNFMIIYNPCERDLVTNNRRLAYCVVLLYNRK